MCVINVYPLITITTAEEVDVVIGSIHRWVSVELNCIVHTSFVPSPPHASQ